MSNLVGMIRNPQAQIYRGELDFLSECVLYYPNTETGGDYFGFWTKEGNPVIQYVLGPGDKSTRTSTSFYQDIDYLRACGTFLNQQYGLEHIGAWHSHHTLGLLKPSGGDIQTMRNALRNDHTDRFLISICNIENRASVSVGGFLFTKDSDGDYTTCNIHTLSGNSPFRENLRKSQITPRSFYETNQRIGQGAHIHSIEGTVAVRVRDSESTTEERKTDGPRKPHFSDDSIWSKREGQQYLKTIYDRLRDHHDLSPVEIKQLVDERPAISFSYYGVICEIRYPLDFPASLPDVIITTPRERQTYNSWHPFRKQKKQSDNGEAIQRIINSLNLTEDGRRITLRYE